MKKTLLSILALTSMYNASSQILQSEDFDSLPIGAVGTDATGTIPTNNYFTLSTNYDLDPLATTTGTNAGPENFQIADYGDGHGLVLQIEGTNGDKGRRNMWQGGLADQWAFRDPENNKIQVEFDLFTGAGGGESNNTKGMYIYDSATDGASLKILGGFVFNTKTLILQGIGYYTSPTAPIANYGFFLGPTNTNITLPTNEWVRLAVSFNKSTGQIIWKGPTFLGQVVGAAIGLDPDKVALVSRSGTVAANGGNPAITNTAATTAGFFDNLLVTANNIDLLGVNEIVATNFSVYAYPNPTQDFLTISSVETDTITAITLTDVNGRIVRNESFNQESSVEMNIADLSNGMYLMKTTTSNGTSIQKIFKN
ncbi:MAG: T9SS type A sorting domain-containing protein [Flavobacterium sp.]|nr:T9SS type A sorting domain-containing protein [Flavobacterium sp.]